MLPRDVRAWKAQQGCVDCGTHDPDALDCDHDVDETKFANIADIRNPEILMEELKKVVVRCVRCHRRVTAMRRAMIEQEFAELDEYCLDQEYFSWQ